jgi:hypothetical protein
MRAVWSATIQTPLGSAARAATTDTPSAAPVAVKHKTNARNELRSRIAIFAFLLVLRVNLLMKRRHRRIGSESTGCRPQACRPFTKILGQERDSAVADPLPNNQAGNAKFRQSFMGSGPRTSRRRAHLCLGNSIRTGVNGGRRNGPLLRESCGLFQT